MPTRRNGFVAPLKGGAPRCHGLASMYRIRSNTERARGQKRETLGTVRRWRRVTVNQRVRPAPNAITYGGEVGVYTERTLSGRKCPGSPHPVTDRIVSGARKPNYRPDIPDT